MFYRYSCRASVDFLTSEHHDLRAIRCLCGVCRVPMAGGLSRICPQAGRRPQSRSCSGGALGAPGLPQSQQLRCRSCEGLAGPGRGAGSQPYSPGAGQ